MSTPDPISPAAARLEAEYPWATDRELEAMAAADTPEAPATPAAEPRAA